MPYSKDADPYRLVLASVLADSSGHEQAAWKDPEIVVTHLAALVACGLAFAYGGCGMSDRSTPAKEGPLTRAEVEGSNGEAVLVLNVGAAVLRVRLDSVGLAYIPHPTDTADAGFLLVGRAADDATRAWEGKGRLGPDKLELTIGQEASLLIGAARWIPIRHPFFASQLRQSMNGGIYRPNDAERLKEEAEAKRFLKSGYAVHRADRPNGPLTQDDVDFIGWEALQLSLQPTIELVREIHGRGSPSVVHPMLKNFYATLVQQHLQPAPPAPVPEPLLRFWTALAAEVRTAGEEALAPARAALAASERAVEARCEALAHDRQLFEEEQRVAAAAAVERERHVVSLETRIAGLESELVTSRNVISGFELEIASVRSDRQHLEATLSDARAELGQHRASLKDAGLEHGVLQARVTSLTDALDRSVRAETALRADRDALQREVGGISAELAESKRAAERDEAAAAQRKAAFGAVKAALGDLQAVVQRQEFVRESLDARVASLEPLEKQHAAALEELTRTRATLAASLVERDRLAEMAVALRTLTTHAHAPTSG
jgi:hypothetical protein